MSPIWYFDFISPFAYLQLPRVRALAVRWEVAPRPVLFGAILAHHGQLGPAEIPGKREFTYRMVQWMADEAGVELKFPPAHPFNPIAALRLAIAAGSDWQAVDAIFAHIWKLGMSCDGADNLAALSAPLGIADMATAISAASVKEQLRANTEEAIASGVFGVPTLKIGKDLFWGNDATPMAERFLEQPDLFTHGEYARIASLPVGMSRLR